MKTRYGPNRMRSTTAPETSAMVRDAEAPLEGEEQQVRDCRAVTRLERHVVQERVAEPAEQAVALVEGDRVAHSGPSDGPHRQRGDTHHEGVQAVLLAHEARVEQAERGRHHDH